MEDNVIYPTVCHRYRAVASWSRVQGVGIPLSTVIEIVSIWGLSLILAVPEAVVFDMVTFNYDNNTIRTCMLNPTTKVMIVRVLSCFWICVCVHDVQKSTIRQKMDFPACAMIKNKYKNK